MRPGRAAAILVAVLTATPLSSPVFAQSPAEITGARKTFAEAVRDEEKRDFQTALTKFREVQAVKDTPAVRFRIGACLEGLHRLGEARVAYGAAAEAAGTDPAQAEVATAARDKLVDLERRQPTLTLKMSPNAPPDTVVTIDDQPVEDLSKPTPLDPGEHRIQAHAAGVPPYQSRVTLQEGSKITVLVPLEKAAPPQQPPPPPPPGEGESQGSRTTAGWVLVGGGAALIVVSGITLLVREGAISSIEESCPQNRCPESKRSDVTSSIDRAELMMPLSITAGVLGVAAAGVGIVLLSTAPAKTTSVPAPAPAPTAGGWRLKVSAAPNRTGLFLGGSF